MLASLRWVPRRLLPMVLVLGACRGTQAPGSDAGLLAGDGLTFDFPPIPDGGPAGYALSFDGTKEYATAGDGGFAPPVAPMAVEMWIDCADVTGTQDFLALRTDFISGIEIGLHAGVLAVWRVSVDDVLVAAPSTPAPNTWHHVAYTYDGFSHVLYIDGTAVASQTATTDKRTPTSAWLGTLDGSNNLFRGQMDEVRVWSLTRSADQVVADMRHGPVGPQSGLGAYWTFDDAVNGGQSVDLSGMGNTVTLGDGLASFMPIRVSSGAPL